MLLRRLRPRLSRGLLTSTLSIVALLPVVAFVLNRADWTPEAAYHSWWILGSALMSGGWRVQLGAAGVVVLALAMARFPWRRIAPGHPALRRMALFLALIHAWPLVLYPLNHWYGQGHWLDRAAVGFLAVAILRHPAFLAPFLFVSGLISHQFAYPIGGFTATDKVLPHLPLQLLTCFALCRTFLRVRPRHLVVALIPGVVSCYFLPGCAKLALGNGLTWLWEDRLTNLLVARHQYGWLGWIPEPTLLAVAGRMGPVDGGMRLLSLCFELGAPLMVFRRSWSVALLVLLAGFHLGVLALSGIFFWKWIATDLVIAAYLRRLDPGAWTARNARILALGVLLVLGLVPRLWPVPRLGWLNTPFVERYVLVGLARSGERYAIPPGWFGGYSTIFAQNRFQYLDPGRSLTYTFGSTQDPSVHAALVDRPSLAIAAELIATKGVVRFEERRRARFSEFIHVTCVRPLPATITFERLLETISCPQHILGSPPGSYSGQEPLSEVVVLLRRSIYDGQGVVHGDDQELLRVPLR